MARPAKCRKICHFPHVLEFIPKDFEEIKEPIFIAIDEYETIRLIDKEGLSQEECASFMQIARTTVQRIYDLARKKLACSIVEGRPLKIEGGDFCLCNGQNANCGKKNCYKQIFSQQYNNSKGEYQMKVAVTYENEMVFQHFGHTKQFKVYEVQDNKIVESKIVDTNGSGHGALAGILQALNIDTLICGGIGGGAQNALAAANIKLYGGVTGLADSAVEDLLQGNLKYNPDVKCNHGDSHHHGEGHTCGNHGCGQHKTGSHE